MGSDGHLGLALRRRRQWKCRNAEGRVLALLPDKMRPADEQDCLLFVVTAFDTDTVCAPQVMLYAQPCAPISLGICCRGETGSASYGIIARGPYDLHGYLDHDAAMTRDSGASSAKGDVGLPRTTGTRGARDHQIKGGPQAHIRRSSVPRIPDLAGPECCRCNR